VRALPPGAFYATVREAHAQISGHFWH